MISRIALVSLSVWSLLALAGCEGTTVGSGEPPATTSDRDTTPADADEPVPTEELSPPLRAAEQREFLAELKAKGWGISTIGYSIPLGHVPVKFMSISDVRNGRFVPIPDDGWELTDETYRKLSEITSYDILDLRNVKVTDAGLAILARRFRGNGIIVSGPAVTDAGLDSVARMKSLKRVYLTLTDGVTDKGIEKLASLPEIETVLLLGFEIDGSGLAAFEGTPLQSLLLVIMTNFSDESAKHVAKLTQLDRLAISSSKSWKDPKPLTTEGIRAIAEAHVPNEFEFSENLIDDDLLRTLVTKGWLYGERARGDDQKPHTARDVVVIAISDSHVTDDGFEVLLDCVNTEQLWLGSTPITDATFEKLAAFRRLRLLELDKAKITGKGLRALADLPIEDLDLGDSKLGEDVFEAIARMESLESLSLRESEFEPAWLRHLADHPSLESLDMWESTFGDDGVPFVVSMPKLKELDVSRTDLGGEGLKQLAEHPVLERLSVTKSRFEEGLVDRLKREHPRAFGLSKRPRQQERIEPNAPIPLEFE